MLRRVHVQELWFCDNDLLIGADGWDAEPLWRMLVKRIARKLPISNRQNAITQWDSLLLLLFFFWRRVKSTNAHTNDILIYSSLDSSSFPFWTILLEHGEKAMNTFENICMDSFFSCLSTNKKR